MANNGNNTYGVKISQLTEKAYEDVEEKGYIPVAVSEQDTFKVPVKSLPFNSHDWDISVTDKKVVLWDKKV